ncbi:hypothetical protein KBX20_05700 [Lactobacillus helveticus]|nr:hypothetical protein [Lactobacillus helveticus]MCP9317235.1 hypothetical protein [Lactobacillus helveticus]MDN6022555.1 hypothetical protein [Lactobacillus sp.]MDN6760175.1 hypothetical protein [Lactobacillus sp.]
MLGSPGTLPVGMSPSGVSGVTVMVLCSILTTTVGTPSGVTLTVSGIF